MDDSLLIALISESVNSASLTRRQAAVILAYTIRTGKPVGNLMASPSNGIDSEIGALIQHYNIPLMPR